MSGFDFFVGVGGGGRGAFVFSSSMMLFLGEDISDVVVGFSVLGSLSLLSSLLGIDELFFEGALLLPKALFRKAGGEITKAIAMRKRRTTAKNFRCAIFYFLNVSGFFSQC